MATGQSPLPKISPSALPKRTFPSFSVRRSGASATQASVSTSTSGLPRTTFSPTSIIAAVATSPTSPAGSNHTTGSGKSFRSLRNLLPFGSGTKSSNSNNAQDTSSRSFSVGFGSGRRSINVSREKEEREKDRNRKFSLSNEALMMSSVISIEPKCSSGADSLRTHSSGDQSPPLRRSASLSRLEGEISLAKPLPTPVLPGLSLRDAIEADITLISLRTPSPTSSPEQPPIRYHHPQNMGMSLMNRPAAIAPAELSTIVEADNSGISISKHIPSASSESLCLATHEAEYTIRRPVLQHAASSNNNVAPLMTSSPLQPSSPVQQFSPCSNSIGTGTTPTAFVTTSAPTKAFSRNMLGPSNDREDTDDDNLLEQLSTSQLASQVQAALASTSWGTSSDRAFVIDADVSFIQMHDEDGVRTPSQSETSSFADGDECRLFTNLEREGHIIDADTDKDVDVHDNHGALGTPLDPPSPLSPPTRERENAYNHHEINDDETSQINSSTLSVVNPNLLLQTLGRQDKMPLNPSTLDPDLRDGVHGQVQNHQRQEKPSMSTLGRTMKLSSPAYAHPSMLQSSVEAGAIRSVSSPASILATASKKIATPLVGLSSLCPKATKSSLQSVSHVPTPMSNSTSALEPIPAVAETTVTTSKRRITSPSFLPRLKPSTPPHLSGSQPLSTPLSHAKNSSLPRKIDLPGSGVGASIDGGNSSKIPQCSTPRTAVFSPMQAQVNSPSSVLSTTSVSTITKPSSTNLRRSFGSDRVAVSNPTGGQHQKQQQIPKLLVSANKNASDVAVRTSAASQVARIRPQVTAIKPNEIGLQTVSDTNLKSDSISDINLPNIPITGVEQEHLTWPVTRNNRAEGEDGTRRLTVDVCSRRVADEESEGIKLGLSVTDAKATTERVQTPSPLPVHAPLPSHHHQHHQHHSRLHDLYHSTTPTTPNVPNLTTPTAIRNDTGVFIPNPSPMLPPQPLLPSPIIPDSSLTSISNGFGPEGSISASDTSRGANANGREDGGEKVVRGGSLRSRRVPVPLRLLLGGASSASTGNNGIAISTNSAGGGLGMEIPERRPSPLRSTVQFDNRDSEYFGTDGRTGTRLSMDDLSSVRPLSEMNKPLDSPVYPLSHMRRDSPDSTYQKVVERKMESRPLVRSRVHERDREKEHPNDVTRVRRRSMSVQGCPYTTNTFGYLGAGGLLGGSVINLSSAAAMSARERLARARHGDLGGGSRPWSSLSMRSAGRTENFLSRDSNYTTRSSFYDREISPGTEKSANDRTTGEHAQERSGSMSGIGTSGRYAPLRSTSEYNFAHVRRESFVGGSMDSPTYTTSTSVSGSGSASGGTTMMTGKAGGGTGSHCGDTPRSTSTGAASASTNANKDHERDREELRELREKHLTETGALLSALSDSQRTCRMLREESTELRERLRGVDRDNELLRTVVRELEREIMAIVRERERERERERIWDTRSTSTGLNNSAGPGVVNTSWRGLPMPPIKQHDVAMVSRSAIRMSTNNLMEQGSDHEGGVADITMIRRNQRSKLDNILFPIGMDSRELGSNVYSEEQKKNHNDEDELVMPARECVIHNNDSVVLGPEDRGFESTLAPSNININATSALRRRPSTSSSIFPIPPSNMTMLLHDEMGPSSGLGVEGNQSAVMSEPVRPPGSPSMSIPCDSRFPMATVQPVTSNMSVSPTMETFSMVTESPGSLFLKPEHEMMLDEMESLDLGKNMSGMIINED